MPTKWIFLKSAFDKINLSFLFLVLIAVLVFLEIKHMPSEALINFLEQAATTILGAYIGLIQSHRMPYTSQQQGGTNGQTNGGTTPSGSTSTPPTSGV